MERFIAEMKLLYQSIKEEFKIQYGEIYSLTNYKILLITINLKSSMERFIALKPIRAYVLIEI